MFFQNQAPALCQAWCGVCGLRAHSLHTGMESRAIVCVGLESGALAEMGSVAKRGQARSHGP